MSKLLEALEAARDANVDGTLIDAAIDEVEGLMAPVTQLDRREAQSMFTLIPVVVSGRQVGDGVIVGWTNCGACMKHIRHCGCPGGPAMPKHITDWADQWFTRTDGFGAQPVSTPATAVRGVNVMDLVDAGVVAKVKGAKATKSVERYVVARRGTEADKPFAVVNTQESNRVEAEYSDDLEAQAKADRLNEGITKTREKMIHLTTPDGGGLACGEPLLSEEGATAEINDVTCTGCVEAHEASLAARGQEDQ